MGIWGRRFEKLGTSTTSKWTHSRTRSHQEMNERATDRVCFLRDPFYVVTPIAYVYTVRRRMQLELRTVPIYFLTLDHAHLVPPSIDGRHNINTWLYS